MGIGVERVRARVLRERRASVAIADCSALGIGVAGGRAVEENERKGRHVRRHSCRDGAIDKASLVQGSLIVNYPDLLRDAGMFEV